MAKQTSLARDDLRQGDALVIAASSVGTVFEWYDFYLYGSLAGVIGRQFFSGVNESAAYVFALLAFAAGFVVRPFGAALFGRLGDLWGRKNTFLVTMALMGVATFLVGLLPGYAQAGIVAPVALVSLRLLQGLAIGGEYGGAAVYVAEHAPPNRRGLYGSWIQTTASAGVVLSLLVVLLVRSRLGEQAFQGWGWRIPFLVSAVLLGVSLWIRLRLRESPVFRRMAAEGRSSRRPLADAVKDRANLKRMIIALFGLHAGQGPVWYTSQFYALLFMEQTLRVQGALADALAAAALAIGTPFFLLFGWLSDRIGRKPVMLIGFALAVVTVFPLFKALTGAVNPALAEAAARAPVIVTADPRDCSLQFDPVGRAKFLSSCDIAKSALAAAGAPYRNRPAPPGSIALVQIGNASISSFSGFGLPGSEFKARQDGFRSAVRNGLIHAGYPAQADRSRANLPLALAILVVLMLWVTMACGPIPAAVVEMYPARVRYTSMSLPFHIGNGWFGGFMPTVAFALVAASGDIYRGLWYPAIVGGTSVLIALFFLPETRHADINA